MKLLKDIKSIFILVLVGIVVFTQIRSCKPPDPIEPIHIIDTVYQKVREEVPVYVPKWRTKVETKTDIDTLVIPSKVDTSAILADYYAKYKTIDTLKLTYTDTTGVKRSFGEGVVTDIISRNQIIERGVIWNYTIPTVYHTIIVPPTPKAQVFIGATANVNNVQFLSSVAGSVLYKTKRDKVYSISLGAADNGLNGVQPFLGAGIYWKIQIKKPKLTDLVK